uniref:2,3-dihydro-2,3-dihydroxybenzoate dehydrogenase n=2 Tax=unclassified Streptomyces TaxID=2593676 RepID=A0A0M4NDJ1_9ACTN|nr:2,3-dihydro-3-hydroxyanthranilic acid dehydrogenase [Streptomyces sp. NRRL 12068]
MTHGPDQDGLGLEGRVAVVTGAAGGIGAETVAQLVRHRAAVALVDRDGPALDELVARLRKEAAADPRAPEPRLLAVPADVSHGGEVTAVVERVESELGPITHLVNAAGILRPGPVAGLSERDWDDTLAVNATGVYLMSRAVASRMAPRGFGAIVTVTSNAARTARTGMAAYAASKAAAQAFTKCLGLELAGTGIRCNVVAPGSTDTPMLTSLWEGEDAGRPSIEGAPEAYRVGIPTGRLARPYDVAQAVVFLLSERAGHITLQDLTVDGGATLGV